MAKWILREDPSKQRLLRSCATMAESLQRRKSVQFPKRKISEEIDIIKETISYLQFFKGFGLRHLLQQDKCRKWNGSVQLQRVLKIASSYSVVFELELLMFGEPIYRSTGPRTRKRVHEIWGEAITRQQQAFRQQKWQNKAKNVR